MLTIKITSQFKKDFKKIKQNKKVIQELDALLKLLQRELKLPEKFRDHKLSGELQAMRECHIRPDLLLIYSIDLINQILFLERLGSHSELFR